MAKYLQVRKNGQITLPASILQEAKLKDGDLLEAVIASDGSIRLIPKTGDDHAAIEKHQLQDITWSRKQKRKKAGKK